jgi:hypothetical protein
MESACRIGEDGLVRKVGECYFDNIGVAAIQRERSS